MKKYQSNVHPDQTDKFQYPELLVWLGALFCTIFGIARSIVTKERTNSIPLKEEGILGLLYTLNILPNNIALLYLPYPVQVIGRQARLLAVVLVGIFFSRVKKAGTGIKLSVGKLATGLIITVGVLLFNFAKDVRNFIFSQQNQVISMKTTFILVISSWSYRFWLTLLLPTHKHTVRPILIQLLTNYSPQRTNLLSFLFSYTRLQKEI